MLSPLAIAVQGIGFTPQLVAVQGFGDVVTTGRRSRGVRFEPYKKPVIVDTLPLQEEDEIASDFIISLVLKGFFNG